MGREVVEILRNVFGLFHCVRRFFNNGNDCFGIGQTDFCGGFVILKEQQSIFARAKI